MKITDQELTDLERLCGEATEGEWLNRDWCDGSIRVHSHGGSVGIAEVFGRTDRAFIVASRTALPRLIERVRGLEEKMREILVHEAHECGCNSIAKEALAQEPTPERK